MVAAVWDGLPFSGAKIALLSGSQVVVYLRDDKADIPFPGLWDLPGGGREHDESPIACALREVQEEFGIALQEERVHAVQRYVSSLSHGLPTYFCALELAPSEVEEIRFGDEGQHWRLMDVSQFLDLPDAVPHMKHRLKRYLEGSARAVNDYRNAAPASRRSS